MKKLLLFSAFVLFTAVTLSSCSSGGGGSSPQPSPPFSQSDLAGNWHINVLQSSPTLTIDAQPGWIRGTASVDSAGTVTVTSLYTSASGTTPVAAPTGLVWKIDPWTGIISETGPASNPDFHGKLASNRNIIVGTASSLNGGVTSTVIQLRVLQKIVSGATYSSSDLADKTFMMHEIDSGASDIWTHMTGSTDGSFNVSLGVITKPSGTEPGFGPVGTLSVDPQGIVSLNTNSLFRGVLSPDKTYMVATATDANNSDIYRMTIMQLTGQTFSMADMAGSWHFHGLINGLPAWIYQSLSIDATGHLTITKQLANGAETSPPPPTQINIDAEGNAADPSDPTLHGTVSWGKDMFVSTQTFTVPGGSYHMLGVTVK